MWLIFLYLSLAYTALDLSKQYPPQGYLGVGLDFPMALSSGEWNPEERFSKRRNFVFNSHIVLENEALKLSPGQQAQMALDAFNEMGKELDRYDITSQKSIPGVMLALLFDNEIILSSSQKGPAQFMTDFGDPRLREDLLRCQATFRETYNKDE